jgi:hypothetical protein
LELPKRLIVRSTHYQEQNKISYASFWQKRKPRDTFTKGNSPYTAPIFLIGKKDLDEHQVVMDYRKLNEQVV